MKKRIAIGMIVFIALFAGCGETKPGDADSVSVPEKEMVTGKTEQVDETELITEETEEVTEEPGGGSDQEKEPAVVSPEQEAYSEFIFGQGYQGETEDRNTYFPKLTESKDARFLLRDIDEDGVFELYLCGTIEDGETYFPAFCLLDYQDDEVQTLEEQYYWQKVKHSFLNNNYLYRYEEEMSESPLFYPAEGQNGYDPNQDEWMGDYYDLYLWSPDPKKEEVHLVYEGGGFHRGDQYVSCPYVYLYNDEKVTKEEYDTLLSQYTENAQIPAGDLQPLSKENLLKAMSQVPAEAPQQENKPDLQTLLQSVEGDYTDYIDLEYPRSFYIGRYGMSWIGGYPVTAEDVVDYGADYIVFQDDGGTYYKVTITDDALFISYGNTPAAIKNGTVIDRDTKQSL